MREECRHYESRTYANGETVRKCRVDAAPDAPWRCPASCPSFDLRIGVGWTYGTLVNPSPVGDVPGLDDGTAAAVLDEAEDIINSISARTMAEVEAEHRSNHPSNPKSPWRRLFRRD